MAELRVHQWIGEDHTEAGMDWEEESYRQGCAYARELAERRLKALDAALMRSRPKGLRLVGSRVRSVVTRFGDMSVRRRMYRDSDGESVFALDDYLGWKPRQAASLSLSKSVMEMATEMPFRKVSESVSELTAGALSKTTVHRMLQGVGQDALDEEQERCEAQFERGENGSEGQRGADILYTEADGVWVHLQREKRKHYEVKSAIVYRGWRRVAEERYELVGKRMYGHGNDAIAFWEGASVEWAKSYDLSRVKLFVVGGDGANWIRNGVGEFGDAVFQLDLSRACGRGSGAELSTAIYDAIRSGQTAFARSLMSAAPQCETKAEGEYRRYVESNATTGVDWRNRVSCVPSDARSLGTMESNGDKTIANRMKKRGMSWTVRGAQRMAKTIQLGRNGELSKFCRRRRVRESAARRRTQTERDQPMTTTRHSDWAEISVPALNGPHSSRPWASQLRQLLRTAY